MSEFDAVIASHQDKNDKNDKKGAPSVNDGAPFFIAVEVLSCG
ncbi:hypothetical protein ACX80D_02375 [Arthrobacter sp. Sr24]